MHQTNHAQRLECECVCHNRTVTAERTIYRDTGLASVLLLEFYQYLGCEHY
jgi:hypothetical protein